MDWYPWGKEAFARAEKEDKPVFLSIGYSACHWCHVIAHESFEDREIAELLNRHFISIKVDKEERPDIDSVYMTVCQAFTGSGGWPTSIFMTANQEPFFAGTYFPKTARGGMIGLKELLLVISQKWKEDRTSLLANAKEIAQRLQTDTKAIMEADESLIFNAKEIYARTFDRKHGGFGRAPKFPTPHNLLFLLAYHKRYKDKEALEMAERTLLQMYCGGLFDHIGFGFCRYSTDKKFLVPHFEKMLYDNALLISAYAKAYEVTHNGLFLEIAEKTADYLLCEMTDAEGGFFSSQDADSEGEEGKYYLFTPKEITDVLGKEDGERFNRCFDITNGGNFEGKSIPNLLKSGPTSTFDALLPALNRYRKQRHSLHRDDKILCFWNALTIAALCQLYLVSKKERYLTAAQKAERFIEQHLAEHDTLFVSFRSGKRGVKGFLDDYAGYILAQLYLYRATLKEAHLWRAKSLCDKAMQDFSDKAGGFYLYGKENEALLFRPKETYDGALPSGNSLMAYVLVWLAQITEDEKYKSLAREQLDFIAGEASAHPTGYAMFLYAWLIHNEPPMKVTVIPDADADTAHLALALPSYATLKVAQPTKEMPQKNNKTTFYVCRGNKCLPPTNDMHEII